MNGKNSSTDEVGSILFAIKLAACENVVERTLSLLGSVKDAVLNLLLPHRNFPRWFFTFVAISVMLLVALDSEWRAIAEEFEVGILGPLVAALFLFIAALKYQSDEKEFVIPE